MPSLMKLVCDCENNYLRWILVSSHSFNKEKMYAKIVDAILVSSEYFYICIWTPKKSFEICYLHIKNISIQISIKIGVLSTFCIITMSSIKHCSISCFNNVIKKLLKMNLNLCISEHWNLNPIQLMVTKISR